MRLMACFGVVVLLVILDSLSKALATAEETKRNQWLKDNIGGPPLDREIRWDSPKSFGRIPRTVKSFGRIPRNLKSFGRVPRTFDDSERKDKLLCPRGKAVEDEDNSFGREIRWHPRRTPQLAKMRPPRNGGIDNANVDDKFLEEMSRRAWGARFMPGSRQNIQGKRDWDNEDNFDFKRTEDEQALLDAVLEFYDSRNTFNNKED